MRVARAAGVDAIHPGYGFLAENPELADACVREGITWIGPPKRVMERLGNKVEARAMAERAGVPVMPATGALPPDPAEARRLAEEVGFPLMVKASWGGGGRGMRMVHDPAELDGGGGGRPPRGAGGLRQRRGLPGAPGGARLAHRGADPGRPARRRGAPVRARLHRAAAPPEGHRDRPLAAPGPGHARRDLRRGGAAGARGALPVRGHGRVPGRRRQRASSSSSRSTRAIQVEHTVTEVVTGIDIVKAQIRLAEGARDRQRRRAACRRRRRCG